MSPDNVVSYCYRSGAQTIQEMFSCSGSLVVPSALDSCLKGALCDLGLKPVALESYLSKQDWNWKSQLQINPVPDYVRECAGGDDEVRRKCIQAKVVPPIPEVGGCQGLTADPDAFGRCLVNALPEGIRKVALCAFELSTADPLACGAVPLPDLGPARKCIALSRGDEIDRQTIGCFLRMIPNQYATFGSCVLQGEFNSSNILSCVTTAKLADFAPKVGLVSCLIGAGADLVKRCAPSLPELSAQLPCIQSATPAAVIACLPNDGTPVSKCLRAYYNKPDAFIACYGKTFPQVQQLYCLAHAATLSDAIAVCLADKLPSEPRRVISCVLKQTDKKALLTCAAAPYVSADLQRILACAAGSERSYFQLGMCLLGQTLNKEWAIAAKCAEVSKGQPVAFAGCTSGLLTQRELNKCFTSGIGTEGGCFGPNNTLVKTVDNIISDLTNGPSDSNEIVKGYHAAEQVYRTGVLDMRQGVRWLCQRFGRDC
jgi:hypothetical protein